MIRFGVLCLVVATSSIQGQAPCGCPYKPKSGSSPAGVAYEPTRLMVIDNSIKSCAITCENGYQLENRANYAECTNGQIWTAQQRESFTTRALVDNPYLTCIKSVPKTCPPNTWKTFTCTTCDTSKIMVTPGTKGDCTIMCDRGFRLVMVYGGLFTRLAEATLKSSNWIRYSFGQISVAESVPAVSAQFNCEPISNSKTSDPAGLNAPEACGCPYKPKIGTGMAGADYEPSRLMVIDNSTKSCAITCERGYQLENFANYAECSGQKWIGQQRETFTTQALVDNPFLTCIKSVPKTCPPNTWKTFACANCDTSKIMVTPGTKGECTIMCDRGYRLVMDKGSGSHTRLAEATRKDANWITYAFGSIKSSESLTAAAASFNCEPI